MLIRRGGFSYLSMNHKLLGHQLFIIWFEPESVHTCCHVGELQREWRCIVPSLLEGFILRDLRNGSDPVLHLRPKKKKSLVPVGCQLRSWVGREFILFFYFIFSSGSE